MESTGENEAEQASFPRERVVAAKPIKSVLRRIEEAFHTASSLNSAADATQGCRSWPEKLKQVQPDHSFSQADAVGVICSRGDEAVVADPSSC